MGGEVIESREEPESEEEERQMEWKTTWEDPLTSYLKSFAGLIGDQRTRKTFGEIVKGIITAGSLICQQIAAQSAELSKGKKGSQRVIRLATGESTQHSELDAEQLTKRLREVAVEQLEQAPEEELWLIADSSDLRKPSYFLSITTSCMIACSPPTTCCLVPHEERSISPFPISNPT